MKLLPSVVRVRVAPSHGSLLRLWLPVFLLWPLLFIVGMPLLVLGVLVQLAVNARELPRVLAFLSGCYAVLCELRGTHVDVNGPFSRVFISIS